MADKPNVQFSLAQLRKDVAKVDPFKIALSGSKLITFPDINAMESEESDELVARIENPTSTWGILEDWLSAADVKSLRAEKLSRAELMRLIEVAGTYYKDAYGTAGEDAASASS